MNVSRDSVVTVTKLEGKNRYHAATMFHTLQGGSLVDVLGYRQHNADSENRTVIFLHKVFVVSLNHCYWLSNKVVIQCHDCKWLYTTESTATKQHSCTKNLLQQNLELWLCTMLHLYCINMRIFTHNTTNICGYPNPQCSYFNEGSILIIFYHITLQDPLLVYYKYGK